MKSYLSHSIFLVSLFFTINSYAQSRFFTSIEFPKAKPSTATWKYLSKYKTVKIDHDAFRNYLITEAPLESTGKTIVVEIPMPDGTMALFHVSESPIMEEGLALKYSSIKTYIGKNKTHFMRMHLSPNDFHVFMMGPEGDILIEPLYENSPSDLGVYYARDLQIDPNEIPALACGTNDIRSLSNPKKPNPSNNLPGVAESIAGAEPIGLITYRLALACTGEWGASHGGGTKVSALNKMVNSVNVLNTVYEKDFSVRLMLVANNDNVIFIDAATDPYLQSTTGGALIPINTNIINGRVGGSRTYDVGHVFTIGCTDVGGVAFLASLCNQGNKGGGCTCWYTSDLNYVVLRIFCHEMGHQFSCAHTFSNCNGNESGNTAVEPGSGTTIMSYSGLCGSGLNVETGNLPHPNFFHSISVEQALEFTRDILGTGCGAHSEPVNTVPSPEILSPGNKYIPILTPFELKGSATDMEDGNLTYSWEQINPGFYGPELGMPSLTSDGPLFKVLFPSGNSNRVLPNYDAIFNANNYEKTEFLPTVTRNIDFRFIVRDNHQGSGGVAWKDYNVKVAGQAGPFKVSFPNEGSHTLYKNTCNKIKWDVANTDKAPVNCAKVNIWLIRGLDTKNPILLKANTENDGSELVDIPDGPDEFNVRIKIEAVDNIFFDVSNSNVSIVAGNQPGLNLGVSPLKVKYCIPSSLSLQIRTCAFGGFQGSLNLFLESGLPAGSTFTFSKTNLTNSDQATLMLDLNNLTSKQEFTIVIGAVLQNGDTLRELVDIEVINNNFSDQKLISPTNGSKGLGEAPVFKWVKSSNSEVYQFEIATSPAFGPFIVYTKSNIFEDFIRPGIFLQPNTIYYWRIFPSNSCGSGNPSEIFVFQTVNKTCSELPYPGNPDFVDPGETKSFINPIAISGIINDINVTNVNIIADVVADVKLSLVSPKGTRATLFNYQCGFSLDFDCSFDDDALVPTTCPPLGKIKMRPVEP